LAKGSDTVKCITYQVVDAAALALVKRIEAVCAENNVAPGALAIQFSLRQAFVGSTIVGASKPDRVRQTLGWCSYAVSSDLRRALEDLPSDTVDPEAERVYVPG